MTRTTPWELEGCYVGNTFLCTVRGWGYNECRTRGSDIGILIIDYDKISFIPLN
ncbi:hypothetical protein DAI22_08g152600 [Oryza sativa Japonica Group]|nr:hypothetical protein DAI22_08g152600 [Oryza sativa Japonica Group]